MPSLTPASETTETLTAEAEGSRTLTLLAEVAETLTALAEILYSTQYLWPGAATFPSATTWPGQYGGVVGYNITPLSEATETLTALQES